ncbi:MAG: hypothetical protein ABJ251_22125 [Paracoccaceae bacterium]
MQRSWRSGITDDDHPETGNQADKGVDAPNARPYGPQMARPGLK